ncbi:MAG: hypothetical protein A3K83_07615 [Omnitrophica WOR_2 bacterium RBG_13_44_8b]|nr:MAG: hypothetical protein A3K83_07615 [Omnitrophica WOR_2 bacterium RBG_13_44_8b]
MASLFISLNMGQFSFPRNSAKLDLQSEVRLAMDWIEKDVRQAISWNIADVLNTPSTTHIKFSLWDWNITTNTWDLSADYIEYSYDGVSGKLTRTIVQGANTSTLEFSNLTEAPFYTTYLGQGDPGNTLDAGQLLANNKLIVVIRGQKDVRGALIPFHLISEVRIRNG